MFRQAASVQLYRWCSPPIRGKRENLRSCIRTRLYWPSFRCIFAQRVVSAVIVIVGQVIVCEPFQMFLVQRDHVIRHLPATASNPALRDSVLPWTPDACVNWFNAARPQELEYIAAEFGVPVQYNVPLRTGQWERLSQLLVRSTRSSDAPWC